MATTAPSRLPASFTSVYRLFLRTCSASVLHHPAATRNLRHLWRPIFVATAKVIQELQAGPTDVSTQNAKQEWLSIWEQRIDNTLALLYTSCKTRGLPHELTRNLSLLVTHERIRIRESQRRAWRPRSPLTLLPPDPQTLTQKELNRKEKDQRLEAFTDSAWDPLREVVKLAEGRDEILLGRIEIQRRLWSRRNMRVFPKKV